MTITLHDVSMIMGLEISGVAINHPMHRKENRPDLFKFITNMLQLDEEQVKAKHTLGGIKLTKIRELLEKKSNVDDVARGYLVTLLGSTLFIDKTVDRASTLLFSLTTDLVSVKTYSWASATLAHLYRELGKASRAECAQLAGPSTLLEAWIYEHFLMFRPSLNSNFIPDSHPRAMRWDIHTSTPKLTSSLKDHRRILDDIKAEEVIWLPYGSNVADNFPLSLYHGCIRYSSTIEPYMPDRVLRQFGYVQTPPIPPIKPNKEYKPAHSYSVDYGEGMMNFWDDPSSHCLSETRLGKMVKDPWDTSSDYMSWFAQHTHIRVQNPAFLPDGFPPNQHQISAEAVTLH
ncbi:Protein MAIN-LIKE 1 [Bienertia sinuspersici]